MGKEKTEVLQKIIGEDVLSSIAYLARKTCQYSDAIIVDNSIYTISCCPTKYDHTVRLTCEENGVVIIFYGGIEYCEAGRNLLFFASDQTMEYVQCETYFINGKMVMDTVESKIDASAETIMYIQRVLAKLQET